MHGFYFEFFATDRTRMKMTEKQEKNSVKMTSLEKGLYLMSLFIEEPYRYTLAQLVETTDLNRTTVYRALSSLEDAGMLIRDEKTKEYKMGPVPYRMGNIYLMNANYKESILAILEKIAEESTESVGIARREGNKVMSIYDVEIHQPIKTNDKPGTFYPINKGCYGKCLMAYHDPAEVERLIEAEAFVKTTPNTLTEKDEILAEYKKIRKQGFVESINETRHYVVGVGVPLRNPDGTVENVAAISFFAHDDDPDKIIRMRELLFKYQKELEKYLI